jgi:hypothetical protein
MRLLLLLSRTFFFVAGTSVAWYGTSCLGVFIRSVESLSRLYTRLPQYFFPLAIVR